MDTQLTGQRHAALHLTLRGEFDLAQRPQLAWHLDSTLRYGDVRVDSAAVTFIDAGCLRLLDATRAWLTSTGRRFSMVRSSPTFDLVAVLAGYPRLRVPAGTLASEPVSADDGGVPEYIVTDIVEGSWTLH